MASIAQTSTPTVPYSGPQSSDTNATQKIGFVGLGAMGYLMARNLANYRVSHLKGSTPVLVWNRTFEKSKKLLEELGETNVRIAQDLAQVAEECDIIITNLANDTVVKSVYEQLSNALSKNPSSQAKIFVETSTIYPSLAGELDKLLSHHAHVHLITCPVFGTPVAADKAQLLIVMSGDYHSKKEVEYLLVPAVGRKVFDLGGNLEKAPTLKLIGNSMILGSLEILAEAHTLAEKSGIGSPMVHNLVQELFPAPAIMAYSNKITNDLFDGSAGFAIEGGIKDASHIRHLTSEFNSPMPVIDVAYQHLLTARAIHLNQKQEGQAKHDILDWSGMVAGARVAAGLDGLDSSKHITLVRED